MTYALHIDIETFSDVDLLKSGVYKYTESSAFDVLLIAYAVDDGPVTVIDLASGDPIPSELSWVLRDPMYEKFAYNAAFEWTCLTTFFRRILRDLSYSLPPDQWRDVMMHGLYAGFTAGLDATGRALGLPEDKQKLATGKALIRFFCTPCKPTKANNFRTRNMPADAPDKWQAFKEYNGQDVVTEREIETRLAPYPVPEFVQKQWETDLFINARGVAVDSDFVRAARTLGETVKTDLTTEAIGLSGLENPNSVFQLTTWLNAETDEETQITDLRKETVSGLLAQGGHSDEVQRMLEIRQELGKTSTKKYDAIEHCVCADGRVRGLLQFYGANRTGRWAGRLVQVQNLPRTYIEPLDLARQFVREQKKDHLRVFYGPVPDVLSQLIRTAFTATPGNVLIDADFSAIEARVIAWLSGEQWVLDAFRAGKDIYCETASQMFGVPVVKGGENGHLRQRGKVAVLACGYQGGVGAMRRMDTGHLLDAASDDEVQGLVNDWRKANPHTVQLWYDIQRAVEDVINNGGVQTVRGLTFEVGWYKRHDNDFYRYLSIQLPSGRKLYYNEPGIGENRFGGTSISYAGVDQTTKKWTRIETYGGKLTENVVQAIARDCLAAAIDRLEAAGLPIVFHVHDEVVIDIAPFGTEKEMLQKVADIMSMPVPWAPDLPLKADGWVGEFYRKD